MNLKLLKKIKGWISNLPQVIELAQGRTIDENKSIKDLNLAFNPAQELKKVL